MKLRNKNHFSSIQSITRNKIPRVDFHLHTTWTDGENSILEMYNQSVQCNLAAVLFTEHARKTSGNWFPEFAREIRNLPKTACQALVGVETKIEDFSGGLDCTQAIFAEVDLVMASVHRFPGEKGTVRGFGDVNPADAVDLEFKLAIAILENPEVDILGHPFGMCYRRYHIRPPQDKVRALIEVAARTGVAFEVNTHYHPNPWQLVQWCLEAGATLSLGSNAHSIGEVGRVVRILKGKEQPWCPSEF